MRVFFFLPFVVAFGTGWANGDAAPDRKSVVPRASRLFGSIHSTAYYFVDFIFGYPSPQRQSLIVDTGSSVLAFGCHDCGAGCGDHIDPKFRRDLSATDERIKCRSTSGDSDTCDQCGIKRESCSTCQTRLRSSASTLSSDHCGYTIQYLEGSSLNGLWYSDLCWLGHEAETPRKSEPEAVGIPVRVPFGCHYEETSLFKTQLASGILGLEQRTSFGPRPFIKAALDGLSEVAEGRGGSVDDLALKGFALCFASNGGAMTVGGSNSDYHVNSKGDSERKLFEESATTTSRIPVLPIPFSPEDFPRKLDPSDIPVSAPKRRLPPRKRAEKDEDQKGHMLVDVDNMDKHYVDFDSEVTRLPEADRPTVAENGGPSVTVDQAPGIQWVDLLPGDSYHLRVSGFGVGTRMFHPEHTKTGEKGMVALLDSGTTLFYLRWIIYAETVFEIDQAVSMRVEAQESANREAKRNKKGKPIDQERIMAGGKGATTRHNAETGDMVGTGGEHDNGDNNDEDDDDGIFPHHLTGASFEQLKHTTDEYILNVTAFIDGSALLDAENEWMSLLKEADDGWSNEAATPRARKLEHLREYQDALTDYVEEMKNFRRRLDVMEEEQKGQEAAAEAEAGQRGRRLTDVQRSRIFRNTMRSVGLRTGRVSAEMKEKFDFIDNHPSAHHRTAKAVTRMDKYVDEECWSTPNGDRDLSHFPKIIIQFDGGAQFVWEPSAYLYKKGKEEIRCLAIGPQGVDPSRSTSGSNDVGSLLDLFGHEAVLGSSFFIGHDVVFDLEKSFDVDSTAVKKLHLTPKSKRANKEESPGRIGFVEAACPEHDFREDRGHFKPGNSDLYAHQRREFQQ